MSFAHGIFLQAFFICTGVSGAEGGGCTHVHRHGPCPGTRSPAFTRVLAPLTTGLNAYSGNAPCVGGFHRAWTFSLSSCLRCAAAMPLPSLVHSHPRCHPAFQGHGLASKLPQLCMVSCTANHIQLKCSFLPPRPPLAPHHITSSVKSGFWFVFLGVLSGRGNT